MYYFVVNSTSVLILIFDDLPKNEDQGQDITDGPTAIQ